MDTLKMLLLRRTSLQNITTSAMLKANIFSKHDYFGRGDYLYVDENEKKFMIHLTSIQPDTTGQTVSQGVISEKDNFNFNDYFSFARESYAPCNK